MRTYNTYDDKGDQQMILVGVNSAGDNIWDLSADEPLAGVCWLNSESSARLCALPIKPPNIIR